MARAEANARACTSQRRGAREPMFISVCDCICTERTILPLYVSSYVILIYKFIIICNMLSQIYKASRALAPRLYPTRLVFKDGSSLIIRYDEPRHVLKMPLTLEECVDEKSKMQWQIRRRVLRSGVVDSDKDDVKFDARKYLRNKKLK